MNDSILFTNQVTGRNVFEEQEELRLLEAKKFKPLRQVYSPVQKSLNTASNFNNRTRPLINVTDQVINLLYK